MTDETSSWLSPRLPTDYRKRVFHVLSLGAGVQSTTLYLLSQKPDPVFHFDCAIFADTGDEPGAVYHHLHWLRSLGDPPILVRTVGNLGDDVIRGLNTKGGRFTSIPAYVKKDDGSEGMVRRQCTTEYKAKVVTKSIRRDLIGLKYHKWMPKDVLVYQYFGITTDEASRAERAKSRFEKTPWTIPVYPLIEMGWSRKDCIRWLSSRVPHSVPKSACVFCPYRTNQSWKQLKDTDPKGFARAVEVDSALRSPGVTGNSGLEGVLYLHRSFIPLDMVDFSTPSTLDPMSVKECEGMCGL